MPVEPVAASLLGSVEEVSRPVSELVQPKPNLMVVAKADAHEVSRFDAIDGNDITVSGRSATKLPADCQPSLNAEPTAAAMVQLDVVAPCNLDERLTVHHNGMMFTEATDGQGNLTLKVPALSENAVFMVSFATGETLVSVTEVSSLGFYDRAVVQWRGNVDLQIHALEFGADYGESGHVWSDASGRLEDTVSGQGGFLTLHGDPALPDGQFAQIYTFPSLTSKSTGTVRLTVEAGVTDQHCGSEIEAQSIQYTADQPLQVQDLVLQMPECDEFGGYLVLKNLLEDLTIASK